MFAAPLSWTTALPRVGLARQVPGDRAERRPPGHGEDHVGVEPGADQARRRQRHLLEPLDLAVVVGNCDDVGLDAVDLTDLLPQARRVGVRRPQRDLDEPGLAGVLDHPGDRRPRGAEVLGDGLHREVLQVVHGRSPQDVLVSNRHSANSLVRRPLHPSVHICASRLRERSDSVTLVLAVVRVERSSMSTSGTSSKLTPQSRAQSLDALRASAEGEPLDVLVIGGGVTGAGIALDAVTRGLTTAVVEAQDWAAGTSSRSSKLVHGGLRYLQMLDFNLVHEALTERDLLIKKLAPHLVKPVSFLYPLEHRVWERGVRRRRHHALRHPREPHPGQARAAVPQARVPQGHGAAVPRPAPRRRRRRRPLLGRLGRRRPPGLDPDPHRRVLRRAAPRPARRSSSSPRTRAAVSTAPCSRTSRPARTSRSRPATSSTRQACGPRRPRPSPAGPAGCACSPRKGVHIVVPRERIKGTVGLILQTEKSVLFVIPWSRYWVIGTTDTPWKQELQHPVATAADIDYVLEHANAVLADPLTRDDIIGTWAGLRPLLQPGTKEGTSSAKVSREHTVASPVPGPDGHRGRQAHDLPRHGQGRRRLRARRARAKARPSITTEVPLLGAVGLRRPAELGPPLRRAPTAGPRRCVDHLLHRYGSLLADIVELVRGRPGAGQAAASTRRRTCGPRSPTRSATRASCTSRTSCCTAPASTTRSPTAGSPPSRRSRRSPRRCSAGTTDTRLAEVASYTARAEAEAAAEHEPRRRCRRAHPPRGHGRHPDDRALLLTTLRCGGPARSAAPLSATPDLPGPATTRPHHTSTARPRTQSRSEEPGTQQSLTHEDTT